MPVRIEGARGRITSDEIVLPKFEAVEEYVDAAITDGLDSAFLRAYLDRMGFDVDAYEPLAGEMDASGEITESDARDRRLEYADRLEADVRRVSSLTAD